MGQDQRRRMYDDKMTAPAPGGMRRVIPEPKTTPNYDAPPPPQPGLGDLSRRVAAERAAVLPPPMLDEEPLPYGPFTDEYPMPANIRGLYEAAGLGRR